MGVCTDADLNQHANIRNCRVLGQKITLSAGIWYLDTADQLTSSPSSQQLHTIRPHLPLGRNVAVQRLPGDAEFGTQRGHLGLRLPHRRHGQPQLGCRHLEWPPTFAAPSPCGGQPRHRALGDQFPLKLCQGSEDAKDQLARRRSGQFSSTHSGSAVRKPETTAISLDPLLRLVDSMAADGRQLRFKCSIGYRYVDHARDHFRAAG